MSKEEKDLITSFFLYFDGVYDMIESEGKVSTYQLGLCDLKLNESKELEVTLRRPGLLIGKGGRSLKKLEEFLECKVKIIEKKFY